MTEAAVRERDLPDAGLDFLVGGGEMGELIRTKDWRATALGDPAHWPLSLRTAVGKAVLGPRAPGAGGHIARADPHAPGE